MKIWINPLLWHNQQIMNASSWKIWGRTISPNLKHRALTMLHVCGYRRMLLGNMRSFRTKGLAPSSASKPAVCKLVRPHGAKHVVQIGLVGIRPWVCRATDGKVRPKLELNASPEVHAGSNRIASKTPSVGVV